MVFLSWWGAGFKMNWELLSYILFLSGLSDACQEKLRSRCLFVSPVQNLLNNLTGIGIHAFEWMNDRWNMEYCENTSRLFVFIPRTSARPVGMSLPQTAWFKLSHLWTVVVWLHLSMHKWSLAPSPNCEWGTFEQTADHVLMACPIHQAPHSGLMVLDDETRLAQHHHC